MALAAGYQAPRYQPQRGATWYHAMYGHVPGHQLDFIYRPRIPHEKLRPQHFSDLQLIIRHLQPPVRAQLGFAFCNLSAHDTQHRAGHGALAVVVSARVHEASDHAGRGAPVFAHAITVVDQPLDARFLSVAACSFAQRFRRTSADWYRGYYRGDDPLSGSHQAEYVTRFSDLPQQSGLRDGPPEQLRWRPRGSELGYNRLYLLCGEHTPLDEQLGAAARLAALFYHSKISWLAVTNCEDVAVEGLFHGSDSSELMVYVLPNREGLTLSEGSRVLTLESLPGADAELAAALDLAPMAPVFDSSAQGPGRSPDARGTENPPSPATVHDLLTPTSREPAHEQRQSVAEHHVPPQAERPTLVSALIPGRGDEPGLSAPAGPSPSDDPGTEIRRMVVAEGLPGQDVTPTRAAVQPRHWTPSEDTNAAAKRIVGEGVTTDGLAEPPTRSRTPVFLMGALGAAIVSVVLGAVWHRANNTARTDKLVAADKNLTVNQNRKAGLASEKAQVDKEGETRKKAAEEKKAAEAKKAEELRKKKAEEEKKAEELRKKKAEEEKKAEELRKKKAEEEKKAEELRKKKAEEEKKAEELRKKKAEEEKKAEELRKKKAEEEKKAEELRKKKAEEEKKAEELRKKKAEEEKKAQELRKKKGEEEKGEDEPKKKADEPKPTPEGSPKEGQKHPEEPNAGAEGSNTMPTERQLAAFHTFKNVYQKLKVECQDKSETPLCRAFQDLDAKHKFSKRKPTDTDYILSNSQVLLCQKAKNFSFSVAECEGGSK